MTDVPTLAREAALHFEAKKTGFGQAQDGWSLTLRIQHADVPDAVRDALKGTRYMVAMVELGDDELPVNRKGGGADNQHTEQRRLDTAPRPAATVDKPQSGGARKRWDEMPAAQQSGILCSDKSFWRFLEERHLYHIHDDADAADAVREICNVSSRSELTGNPTWSALVLDYRLWQREPEFAP